MKTLAECLGILQPGTDPKWLKHPSWLGLMNETCAEFLRVQGWAVTARDEATAKETIEGQASPGEVDTNG